MAEQFAELSPALAGFISRQKIFFVGTAAATGSVNVSPKGCDSLRVLDSRRVAWLNLTGSGNESAAHVLDNPRMTLMFCSFDRKPLILRLYGKARVLHPRDADWADHLALFPPLPGARQCFLLDIELVQTSCGFGVPYYDYTGERPALAQWVEKKGAQGIRDYWREKNRVSLDGFDTMIVDE